MSTLRDTLASLGRSLVERPDELMREIGAGGELLLARLRVAANILILSLPLLNHLGGGSRYETLIGLAGAGVAFALSLVWLAMAKRPRQHRCLPFVTGIFDVTLVSLVLTLVARQDPVGALNSQVVFSLYMLAIIVSALKNDGRASLFIGLLALLQYIVMALALIVLNDPAQLSNSPVYGSVILASQLQRAAVLLVTTLITAVIVYRLQRLVMLSGTDSLTGLPNRSYLVHRVPHLLADARRDGVTLTVALIDLDHFKRVNDEFGHPVGDRALRHAVGCLREAAGRSEPLIRIGGEEFLLVMHLPIGTAWEKLESLREALARIPFSPGGGNAPLRMTLSAGLAACPQDALDVSGLLRRADLRLREAKRCGRNRVIARD